MIVFPVSHYPWRTFAVIMLFTVGLPLTIVALALFFAAAIPSWLFIFALSVGLGFILSLTVAAIAVLLYSATKNEISLRDETIHIKCGGYHERVPIDAITRAEVVDLRRASRYQPVNRENGLRLPGYHAGWYTLSDGTWTFVLKTARSRVAYIETDKGFAVLLGVRNPQQLIDQATTTR